MQTLLVTGGAGFIGGCFVRQLVAEHTARVVNLDKLTYAGNLASLAAVMDDPWHVFVRGDMGDDDWFPTCSARIGRWQSSISPRSHT